MQQIIFFLQKYKYFLFFLILEFIAVFLMINNHAFHKSKFVNSANAITGGFYQKATNLSDYLSLNKRNNELILENNNLKNQLQRFLSKKDTIITTTVIDTSTIYQKYVYFSAKIIKNDYHKFYNFLTINRGKKQGVTKEMAVINNNGIIGITETSTPDYTRVQSILNLKSKINARLKNSSHFGTLIWNGKDYNVVQLTDLPRQAQIKKGDTILTGGKSTIFPEGILIGSVVNITQNNTDNNSIDIRLFNDMSNINNVYVIRNLYKAEIESLENNRNE